MDTYAILKRFNNDNPIQVYNYDLMYVDTETMPAEGDFKATKQFLITTRKYKLEDQSQIMVLNLVTYVHNIMS